MKLRDREPRLVSSERWLKSRRTLSVGIIAGLAVSATTASSPADCSSSGSFTMAVTAHPHPIINFDQRSSEANAPGSSSSEFIVYNTGGEVDITAPDPGNSHEYEVLDTWSGGTKALVECYDGSSKNPTGVKGGNYGGPDPLIGTMYIVPGSQAEIEVITLIQQGLGRC